MALENFQYTKTWRSADDFPTIETDETQVRDDIQCLFDEIADGLNGLTTELNSGGVDTAQLADGAVTTAKIEDGAVTEDKLDIDVRHKMVGVVSYGDDSLSDVNAASNTYGTVLCVGDFGEVDDWHYLPLVRQILDGYFEFEGIVTSSRTLIRAVCDHNGWSYTKTDLAPVASPTFTGTPQAPTPTSGDNSTKIATTAFVKTAVDNAKEVFWVTYDATTFPQIANAISQGKMPIVAYNGLWYMLAEYDPINSATFTAAFDYGAYYVQVDTGGTWANGYTAFPSVASVAAKYTKPMNGIPKTDLASAVQASLGKADTALQSAHEVPSGGTSGQVLAKNSNTDYDLKWVNQSGGGGSSDYDDLTDKPSINSVTLSGNKTTSDLKLDQIFWATYGTTSPSDIKTAYNAGKAVICVYDDGSSNYIPLMLGKISSDDTCHFYGFVGHMHYMLTVETGTPPTYTLTNSAVPQPQSSGTPAALGTAARGIANTYSRSDHVHDMPSASDVGAVAVSQGVAHAGEFVVVGSDGNITTVTMTAWSGGNY